MRLLKSTLERNFTVKHNGETYYISYLNSNGQILGLLNRDYWEVLDEEFEEINIFQNMTKKEEEQLEKIAKLRSKLIKFCINHFNDYQPNYKEDF